MIRPAETLTSWDHLHGAAMLGWCLLLIAQAFLIRTKHGSIHRRLGRVSFVWGPLVVMSTLVLAHYRLNTRGLTPDGLYLLAIQLFLLAQFVICYGFAIRHRRQRDRHARFMVCTALPLLDPIFARILVLSFSAGYASIGAANGEPPPAQGDRRAAQRLSRSLQRDTPPRR